MGEWENQERVVDHGSMLRSAVKIQGVAVAAVGRGHHDVSTTGSVLR